MGHVYILRSILLASIPVYFLLYTRDSWEGMFVLTY